MQPIGHANGRLAFVILEQQARELLNVERPVVLGDSQAYFAALQLAHEGDISDLRRIITQALFGTWEIEGKPRAGAVGAAAIFGAAAQRESLPDTAPVGASERGSSARTTKGARWRFGELTLIFGISLLESRSLSRPGRRTIAISMMQGIIYLNWRAERSTRL